MKNKLLVIAGQTGVGKTEIAYRVAKMIPKSEIILADHVQALKYYDISGNKPPKEYTSSGVIKYHNLDTIDPSTETYNAVKFANETRKIISKILSKGGFPILEGGAGFYLKMLLTGADNHWSEEEHNVFLESKKEASKMILEDNNFFTTLDRISQVDSTFPREIIQTNDTYRLERHLAETLMYGDKAYQIVRNKEIEKRQENSLDCDIYKTFLVMDKLKLNVVLNKRCEKMLKDGLLTEVLNLLKIGVLSNEKINDKMTPGVNAFGVKDVLEFLIKLSKVQQYRDKFKNSLSKKGKKIDPYYLNYKKQIIKMTWDFLVGFSTKNRQYSRRQTTWFRNQDDYLWINVNGKSLDELASDVISYTSKSYGEFANLLKGDDNLNRKQIFTDKGKADVQLPEFDLIKNQGELLAFITEAFDILERNKEIFQNLSKKNQQEEKIIQDDSGSLLKLIKH